MSGEDEHPRLCCGARHAADRKDETEHLAQMALDHRAMTALRRVLKHKSGAGGFGVVIQVFSERGADFVEVKTATGSVCGSGPDVETALCTFAKWPPDR
jgi:hypothetical protein